MSFMPFDAKPINRLNSLLTDEQRKSLFSGLPPYTTDAAQEMPQNYIQNTRTGVVTSLDQYAEPNALMRQMQPALDYTSGPVEMNGMKGYRLAGDPFTVMMPNGTKLNLGRDTGEEIKRDQQKLAMESARLKNQETQADIELKRGQIAQGGKATVPVGFRLKKDASGDMEPIPGGPSDLKTQKERERIAEGVTDVDVSLGTLRDAYNRLEEGGGITSVKNNPVSNAAASVASSGIGQAAGKLFGTQNQSARNDIAMARPALLAALMKATGMSAKQMDSNAELKLWLSTATDPTLDVEANRRALDNIERKYLHRGQSMQPSSGPQVGAIVKGYRFNGGDPANPASWTKVP